MFMYSSSSSSSDSENSSDSYGVRQPGHSPLLLSKSKRKSMPKLRKALYSAKPKDSPFENDAHRYTKAKGARSFSPVLTRYGSHLNDGREKSYSHRKKHSSRDEDSALSREDLNELKRHHEKGLKNVIKFLEKEPSILNDVDVGKREDLHELKRQHEKEVRKLFDFMEWQLTVTTEKYRRKEADLNEEVKSAKEHAIDLEGQLDSVAKELQLTRKESEYEVAQLTQKLQATKQRSKNEVSQLVNELGISERQSSSLETEVELLREKSVRQSSSLEDEVALLKEKLAEKDERIRFLETQLREDIRRMEDEIRHRDDELRRKDKIIAQRNEAIRSLNSKPPRCLDQVENFNTYGFEWEETSALTSSSDYGIQKENVERNSVKPPYKLSPAWGKNAGSSLPRRRDHRDDLEAGRFSVSFSDEVEQRHLPMQMHDKLSRRLEKLYLDG